jgi:hypothetical protein
MCTIPIELVLPTFPADDETPDQDARHLRQNTCLAGGNPDEKVVHRAELESTRRTRLPQNITTKTN